MQVEIVKPYPKWEVSMYKDHDHVVKGVPTGWEASTLWVWMHELDNAENSIILDIGAYTGIYSLLSAKYGKNVEVVAFEPLSATHNRLTANVRLNQDTLKNPIEVAPFALSDAVGNVPMHVTGDNPLPSGSSIDPHPSKGDVRVENINLITGDSIFMMRPRYGKKIGLVKMDVERHELKALIGLKHTLQMDRPVCIIELLTNEEAYAVFDFMYGIGYTKIYQINDRPLISDKLYTEVTDELVITPSKTNFLFKA